MPPPVSLKAGSAQGWFYFLGSLFLVFGTLYFAQKVLIPLALAILLTFVLSPLVIGLQRRGLGRVPAAMLAVLLALVVLGGIGTALIRQIDSLALELTKPALRENISERVQKVVGGGHEGILANLQDTFQYIVGRVNGTPTPEEGNAPQKETQVVMVERSGIDQIMSAAGPAVEFLATAVLITVLVVFMLVQREDLRNRLVRLVGHGQLVLTTRAIDEAAERISRYLVMQLLVNASFGATLWIGLWLLGVPYAPVWGLLGGFLRFIPYLGIWVACGLLMIFSLAMPNAGWTPVFVFALFLGLEMVVANVIEPLLFGHSTGVSAIALLVSAAFWVWLWGPIGLILSPPITVCLVVLGKYVPQLEFFAILLGDEQALDAEITFYQRILANDQDEAADLVEDFLQTRLPETVFEEVLLPTLYLAKRDLARGELSDANAAEVLAATRRVFNDLIVPDLPAESPCPPGEVKPVVIGCPASDETDELALQMFASYLPPGCCRLEVLSAHVLTGEVLERVAADRPTAVLIGSVPPGGTAPTRYLCKRLKATHPEVKILVGYWGGSGSDEKVRQRLANSGVDKIATTFEESRREVLPLLHVTKPTADNTKKDPAEPVAVSR